MYLEHSLIGPSIIHVGPLYKCQWTDSIIHNGVAIYCDFSYVEGNHGVAIYCDFSYVKGNHIYIYIYICIDWFDCYFWNFIDQIKK